MKTCGECGASNPSSSKFCGECGAPLGTGSPNPTQRRSVEPLPPTVLPTAARRAPEPPPDPGAVLQMLQQKHGQADVLFVLDCTYSMQGELDAIVAAIASFADAMEQDGIRVRVGAIEYRDRFLDEEHRVLTFDGEVFTDNPQTFRQEIAKLQASGGGDIPESTLDALVLATQQPFNRDGNCTIVLVTDAPPHIPDRETPSIEAAIETLRTAGIDRLYLVIRTRDRASEVYLRLFEGVKGCAFELGQGDDFRTRAEDFKRTLMSLGKTISQVTRSGTFKSLAADGGQPPLPQNDVQPPPPQNDDLGESLASLKPRSQPVPRQPPTRPAANTRHRRPEHRPERTRTRTSQSPTYFTVGARKLWIMSVATFNLYLAYWSYKNWLAVKENTGRDMSAFWRAVFVSISNFWLYGHIRTTAKQCGVKVRWDVGTQAGSYFLFYAAVRVLRRIVDPTWGLLTFLQPWTILPVRKTIEQIARADDPHANLNTELNAGNAAAIAVGVSVWMSVFLIGFMLGLQEAAN